MSEEVTYVAPEVRVRVQDPDLRAWIESRGGGKALLDLAKRERLWEALDAKVEAWPGAGYRK